MTKTGIIELAQAYSENNRYEDLIERLIMSELEQKNQVAIDISVTTPKNDLNDSIFKQIDSSSLFCTNKNYAKGESFILVDDEGEVIFNFKNKDNSFKLTRVNIPFESETDIDSFATVVKWLQDEITNVCFINNENIKLNYEIS